jgi:hypothetical protein
MLAVGLVALIGCGGGPNLAEVEGTLTSKGKPLDKIQIEFWPEKDGPRSMAVTDSQGRYTLKTDDGKRMGAVVGPHRIVLHDIGILGDKLLGRRGENVDMAQGKKPRVSPQYSDANKTTLKKDVTAGKNQIDLDVSP